MTRKWVSLTNSNAKANTFITIKQAYIQFGGLENHNFRLYPAYFKDLGTRIAAYVGYGHL